jgi:tetratricopeptide (TPR) repeat protein
MEAVSNSEARSSLLFEEGLRCEKAGLLDKALYLYREARADQSDPALLAESWRLEAYAQHGRCEWDEALSAARRSSEIARAASLRALEAEALNAEAAVHLARGELDVAATLFEAMLEMTDVARVRGLALQNLGILHGQSGQLAAAERRFEEAYVEFERADYAWGQAHVLNNRVALALQFEPPDYNAAARLGREAARLARAEGDLDLLAIARLNLAEALAGQGHLEQAQREASTALGQFQVAGNVWRRIACLRILGDVSAARGDPDTALAMWERGLVLAREIGASLEATQLEERLSRARPG